MALSKLQDLYFGNLSALILNRTLKPSYELSHTDRLLDVPRAILETNGVSLKSVRPVDLNIAPGVQSDMREEGFDEDDWPALYEQVMASDILIIGTPIWLGETGPGTSYAHDNSGGPQNEFTQRNISFMAWNLLHLARILKQLDGFPVHGNLRSQWDAGGAQEHPNPGHR